MPKVDPVTSAGLRAELRGLRGGEWEWRVVSDGPRDGRLGITELVIHASGAAASEEEARELAQVHAEMVTAVQPVTEWEPA